MNFQLIFEIIAGVFSIYFLADGISYNYRKKDPAYQTQAYKKVTENKEEEGKILGTVKENSTENVDGKEEEKKPLDTVKKNSTENKSKKDLSNSKNNNNITGGTKYDYWIQRARIPFI